MVQPKPTPEEQLLKLIEGQNPTGSSGPQAGKPRAARKSLDLFAGIRKISGSFEYWRNSLRKKNSSGAALQIEAVLDIKWLNRALIVMVMITMGYLIIDLSFFKPGRRDFFNHVSVSEPLFPAISGIGNSAKQSSFYLDGIKRRNPFLAPGTVSQTPVNPQTGEAASTAGSPNIITEMLQGYKLVGISWGDEPLAMLEETATGRTYFLRKGQEFKGIKVQEISKERVMMTFEGQEAELF